MNGVQRRLFRAFVETGGDLSEDGQVEGFIRFVESNLVLLPPRVREAMELVWRCPDGTGYERLAGQLSQREPTAVRVASLRQRVSRGTRLLEYAIHQRSWGSSSAAVRQPSMPPRNAAPPPTSNGILRGGSRPQGSAT